MNIIGDARSMRRQRAPWWALCGRKRQGDQIGRSIARYAAMVGPGCHADYIFDLPRRQRDWHVSGTRWASQVPSGVFWFSQVRPLCRHGKRPGCWGRAVEVRDGRWDKARRGLVARTGRKMKKRRHKRGEQGPDGSIRHVW